MSDHRQPECRAAGSRSLWILWDPQIVAEDDYVALVVACGDLVRASGGLGLVRRNGASPGEPEAGDGGDG